MIETPSQVSPVRSESGGIPPQGRRRAIAKWVRRPVLFVPLLLLCGVLAGYSIGAARLAARERDWDARRSALEQTVTTLESSLQQARGQEASYRVLVSISRAVVDLYDRNFGLAAEELRGVREAMERSPAAAGPEMARRLDTLQAELDELSRRVEEMSGRARETVREIEREITSLLFPRGS